MPRLSEMIQAARASAKLSQALMGSMVGLDEARVRQIEAGQVEPAPEELEAYAQVFGVSMRQLAEGEAKRAPLTHLFFRSASEGGLSGLQELVATDGHRVLGELMRCVRDVAELEAMLGQAPAIALPAPPAWAPAELEAPPPHGADKLADWLRAELGLGLDPIASMQQLVETRLGVRLFWVTPEQLSPTIEGASTRFPRPAILVNMVEGPQCWWRIRMTLGHELCHLLFDQRPGDDRFAIFSPHALREDSVRWRLFEGFERIERRAGAFAACFLAPAKAVQRVVSGLDVTSEHAIAAVGKELGLGRTTAINRLQQVFGFSKHTRLTIEARSASHWLGWKHADGGPERAGLRAGVVQDLALSAFAAGCIDRVRVREYLKLPLTEPLPEHGSLTEEQRAPVRRIDDTVRGVAQLYLQEHWQPDGQVIGCIATTVHREQGGFRVDVEARCDESSDETIPCGFLTISHDLMITGAAADMTALETHKEAERNRAAARRGSG